MYNLIIGFDVFAYMFVCIRKYKFNLRNNVYGEKGKQSIVLVCTKTYISATIQGGRGTWGLEN